MHHLNCFVVGCSAGGMKALTSVLQPLSKHFPVPIVIVQHLAGGSTDLFIETLQSNISLKICEIRDKERISSNRVYIAPGDYHVLLEENGLLSLSYEEKVHFSRPSIDVLFESAAFSFGKTIAGILLTGANDDGGKGLLRIHECGGLTIVQDPAEAEYADMPRAALKLFEPDYILTLAEISSFFISMEREI